MSLRLNISVSFASQIFVTLLGIATVPIYIRFMGAEAYGLVGFFAMLQAWFSLLDIGMTPTVARETARYRGGAVDIQSYRQLVRALEYIFLAIAVTGCLAMLLASRFIATQWLQAAVLPERELLRSVQCMALIIALRWSAGLYRGAISGSERLVWLAGFNAGVAIARFGGVIPVLMFVSATPTAFFAYQLIVALIELVVLIVFTYTLLPRLPPGVRLKWHWQSLKPVLRFSLTIAFTSSVWVLFTQTDKLVLSKILPLADYGYFSLAVLVASGIMILSGPIGNAVMPRLARLEAQREHVNLILLYRQATQLVAILTAAAAAAVVLRAESLLFIWTGEAELASHAAPILALYAIGNAILAVSAFPYYLQYAKGDLKLHFIGNAIFVLLLIPAIIWATVEFGGIGAGFVWVSVNLLAFIAWLPFVHHKFAPGLNIPWYLHDVLLIQITVVGASCLCSLLLPARLSGFEQLAQLVFVFGAGLAAGVIASSAVRAKMKHAWRRLRITGLHS